MLEVTTLSFKDLTRMRVSLEGEGVSFIGRELTKVGDMIETYVNTLKLRLAGCIEVDKDCNILVYTKIYSEIKSAIQEFAGPIFITQFMIVNLSSGRSTLVNLADAVLRDDRIKVLEGHEPMMRDIIVSAEDQIRRCGNVKADIEAGTTEGQRKMFDGFFWNNDGLETTLNSDLFTDDFIQGAERTRRSSELECGTTKILRWGETILVKSGYFRLCLAGGNFGGVRPFGNVSFPATSFIRAASICRATEDVEIRRAAINIWGCYRNTINDLCIKKLRRCIGMESVGIMDVKGNLESYKVFSLVLSGSGFTDSPTGLEVNELTSFIDQASSNIEAPRYTEGSLVDTEGYKEELLVENSVNKILKNISDIKKGGLLDLSQMMTQMNTALNEVRVESAQLRQACLTINRDDAGNNTPVKEDRPIIRRGLFDVHMTSPANAGNAIGNDEDVLNDSDECIRKRKRAHNDA